MNFIKKYWWLILLIIIIVGSMFFFGELPQTSFTAVQSASSGGVTLK